MSRIRCLCLLWLCFNAVVGAAPIAERDIPEPLRPWVPWVLHGVEERLCTQVFSDPEQRRCAWPEPIELHLNDRSGTFRQFWEVDTETWVQLPGSTTSWPQEVTIDGKAAITLMHEGRPALRLGHGRYQLHGSFAWEHLPGSLALPTATGLVTLSINKVPQARPKIDSDGNLWLSDDTNGKPSQTDQQDRLEVEIFRHVLDEVPMLITTLVRLRISGQQREFAFAPVLLPESIPMRIDSPLPARLESTGQLRVLLRPGTWDLSPIARLPNDTRLLHLPSLPEPWPHEEVWSFEARNQLRAVTIEGVPSVDPTQTSVPPDWHAFPAYRLKADSDMKFTVDRRGDPDPTPDTLHLQRTLWLDFDGHGYTSSDHITGRMSKAWRLEATPDLKLGRVLIDGQAQLLTHLDEQTHTGVEIRQGRLDVAAESRMETTGQTLPVLGWQHDFRSVRTTLNLPPGWRLLAASGVDRATGAWVDRWSLLDMFLVMIAAYAANLLWGKGVGLLTATTFITTMYEPNAPAWIWVSLIVAVSLLRILPSGRLQQVVQTYYYVSVLALAIVAIPFIIEQIRTGLYPQLEGAQALIVPETPLAGATDENPAPAASAPETQLGDQVMQATDAVRQADNAVAKKARSETPAKTLRKIDPEAKIQTGPGLPIWHWHSLSLDWNGPVEQQQRLHLFLLSPLANFLLKGLRIVLVLLLAMQILKASPHWRLRADQSALLVLITALSMGLSWPEVTWAQIPDRPLLEELKNKLLAPADCAPQCADISRAQITVGKEQLLLRLEVNVGATTAVPIPGHQQQWQPSSVRSDEQAVAVISNAEGGLLARLEPGRHDLLLSGSVQNYNSVQIPLPLAPRKITVEADGWQIDGLLEDGSVGPELRLTRETKAAHTDLQSTDVSLLPDFIRVERTLLLDKDWQVQTRITRLSPADQPVTLTIPVLSGESILTAGIQVKEGKARIGMEAGVTESSWQSILSKHNELTLTAAPGTELIEVWRLAASSTWHVEPDALAATQALDSDDQRRPEWHPWPGEMLHIKITQPAPIAGSTLTIDNSRLLITPGRQATESELYLRIRSSQGGQHSIKLPPQATLASVEINQHAQSLRPQGEMLTIPIVPGTQDVKLVWRTHLGIAPWFRTSQIDLGIPSVNHSIELRIGADRWPLLLGGPRLGPAVLFWGQIGLIILLSLILGRTSLTPLKPRQWFLLGIGLSQTEVVAALLVVGWFLAFGLRSRITASTTAKRFNMVQVGMALWTLLALLVLFHAIERGLLGSPDMQISGNGSSAYVLKWFQDRTPALAPTAWLLSVPLWLYRALMLGWATWLAAALVGWLRWAWRSYSTEGLWRPLRSKAPHNKNDPLATMETPPSP